MRNAISHIRHIAAIGLVTGLVGPALAAEPQSIDWSKIPTKSITLFYPGQSTYDWLVSPAHPGAKQVTQGQGVSHLPQGQREDPRQKDRQGRRPRADADRRQERLRRCSGAGRARRRIRLFPLPMEDEPEPRRAHARLRALRRQAMEMVRPRPQRQGGAGGRTACALRRSLLDHARRRQGAVVRPAGLLGDLPQRHARHAQSGRRRAGEEASVCSAMRNTMPTSANISPRPAPTPRQAGTRPNRTRRSPRSRPQAASSTSCNGA